MAQTEGTLETYLQVMIEGSKLANMDLFSLSDPFAIFEEEFDRGWKEIGRTETIWDVLDPKFVRSFILPPDTRKDRHFRIRLYDRDTKAESLDKQDFIGFAVCTAGEILAAGTRGKRLKLEDYRGSKRPRGSAVLIGEPFADDEPIHELSLGVAECKFRHNYPFGVSTRPYLCIYRRRPNDQWAPIFRSQGIHKKEENAFSKHVPQHICIRTSNKRGSCDDTPIRIELSSHKKHSEHELLGYTHISLGALKTLKKGSRLVTAFLGDSSLEVIIAQAEVGTKSSRFQFEICFGCDFS